MIIKQIFYISMAIITRKHTTKMNNDNKKNENKENKKEKKIRTNTQE